MPYIYALIDPVTHEVRYVGKTRALRRRLLDHLRTARRDSSDYRDRWIAQLLASGQRPVMHVLEEATESDWPEAEQRWVRLFRAIGCRLTNMTDGGDVGASWLGKNHKPETREKMRQAALGRTHTPEARARMREAHKHDRPSQAMLDAAARVNRGREVSPEVRAKISAAQKGVPRGPMSDEHKAKIGAANRGRTHSPEWVEKQRAATKGVPKGAWAADDPRRAELSRRMLGVKKSPEHAAKIAAALRARTHCKHGHEWTAENTRVEHKRDGRTRRCCRACDRARIR